jgi:hypothetical protein
VDEREALERLASTPLSQLLIDLPTIRWMGKRRRSQGAPKAAADFDV